MYSHSHTHTHTDIHNRVIHIGDVTRKTTTAKNTALS